MDYKKKLKDALDDKLVPVEVQEWIEDNFPELVESEDERIRKDLIKFIKGCGAYSQEYVDWLEKLGDIDNKFIRMRETKPKDISEFLDRLTTVEQEFFWEHIAKIRELDKEEQSEQKETLCDKCKKEQPSHSCQDITELGRCAVEHEQKPTDKVEPKFHEGDWVVDKNGIVKQILSYKDGVYKHTDGYSAEIFEDEWRMWDIAKDAKDGDVISYKDEIFIVKNSSNLNIVYYCCYDNYHFITESIYSLTIDDLIDVKPATKEERYLLFQKMKEAGYEWDAEKKKLEKIEQKSAEISNICEFSIETWIKIVDFVLTEHDGIGNYLINPEVKDTAEKLQKKYKFDAASEEWDRVYRKGLDTGVNKGRAEALREQKLAWSEEDERNASYICAALECYYRLREERNNTNGQEDLNKARNWLYNKLKSLNPQNRWKPSEAQMVVLNDIIINGHLSNANERILKGLQEQLKKLREE